MKWQGYNTKAGDKVSKLMAKAFSRKGVYYLLTIAALGLILGASFKWHG
jgi:adenine/guanine phosphoribosyltransferase-like PRPP-binding protein